MEKDFNLSVNKCALKELPVGECFELCKLIYEVRESEFCEGCSFYIEDENECTAKGFSCSSFSRTDGKSVIFVNVGEA